MCYYFARNEIRGYVLRVMRVREFRARYYNNNYYLQWCRALHRLVFSPNLTQLTGLERRRNASAARPIAADDARA